MLSDLLVSDALGADGDDQLPKTLSEGGATAWIDRRRAPRQDADATPALQLKPPFASQNAVRFGDRVEVHVQRGSELTDGGNGIVGFELTARQAGSQPIDNLPVDRNISGEINRE